MARVKIRDLVPGDLVDFENDPYVDPAHSNVELMCEFCVVEGVEKETVNCFVVYTDKVNHAFPPDHEVFVDRSNTRSFDI